MRLDQIFSLFLLLAFLLFSLFYLQHILSGPPERTYPNPIFERQLQAIRNHKGKGGLKPPIDEGPARVPRDENELYEMEERRELGRDVDERELAANEDHSSADEVTFLFAAVDIENKWTFDGAEVDFETYLKKTMELISTEFKDEKVRLIVERKHLPTVEPFLTPNINVRHVDVADLRAWKHYTMIEKIRTADWWAVSAPENAISIQGQSDLYGPVVMHRLFWLRDLAKENPFQTKYFLWMDASTCTPRMSTERGIKADAIKTKARYFMDRFLITITPMYKDHHIHGCNRAALLRLADDKTVCFEVKGWVMGGRRNYIMKIADLYEEMLTKALPLGCLGTEETMMSLVWYTRPDLFHVHYNAPRGVPFDGGDICKFALQVPETDWKEPEMFTQQRWFQEQKKLATEKKAAKQKNEAI
jgi:hypothetical protein